MSYTYSTPSNYRSTGGSPGRRLTSSPYRSGGGGAAGGNRSSGNRGVVDALNTSAVPGADGVETSQLLLDSLLPGNRGSDIRALLLNSERELAELREETSIQSSELETLKAALQREHEATLRAQTRHQADLDEMRVEYERQQARLIEQITVLKGVSESAVLDKNRTADDAAQRKQQLVGLLEREREEKSQIMADYRQQTEALIAEQGREITGLRNLLDASRSEEDKLLHTCTAHEERRSELEEQLLKAETLLAEERVLSQKRLREVDSRMQFQIESLRAKQDADDQTFRQETLKSASAREGLEDQVRSLTERLRQVEHTHETERRTVRESYDADVVTLQEELRVCKDSREKADAAHRKELERVSKGDQELMASLRKTIDNLRQEKQQNTEEARQSREVLLGEQTAKIQTLNALIETLRRECSDERTLRKEADATRQSTTMKFESAQTTVSRLSSELEQTQVETRTRERTAEQEHLAVVESLRATLRTADTDVVSLRQQLRKQDLDLQRATDDLDANKAAMETLKSDHQRALDAIKGNADASQLQFEDARRQSSRTLDVLMAQKVQLDAEVSRLQRNVSEVESRYNAAAKQLLDERRALEASVAEAQSLKNQLGDTKVALERERASVKEVSNECESRQVEVETVKVRLEQVEMVLRETRRDGDRAKEDAASAARAWAEELDGLRGKQRNQTEALENQIQGLKDELQRRRDGESQLEGDLRALRDDNAKLQRDLISREDHHSDTLRALRQQEDDEQHRLDLIINALREDLAKAHGAKAAAQRDIFDAQRDADRRVAVIQEALEHERSTKNRLHDEMRNKEQLAAELQGTVRLLNNRLQAKEDELRRAETEVNDVSQKVHEAHSQIGRKDAAIGQLTARLRVYESRGAA